MGISEPTGHDESPTAPTFCNMQARFCLLITASFDRALTPAEQTEHDTLEQISKLPRDSAEWAAAIDAMTAAGNWTARDWITEFQEQEQDGRASNGLEPVHHWFELSYCAYLVVRQSFIATMPAEWQAAFEARVAEIPQALDLSSVGRYTARPTDDRARFVAIPKGETYRIWPRVVLTSMPLSWQRHFIRQIEQMTDALDTSNEPSYSVLCRDENGRYYDDGLSRYRHHPPLPFK